MVFDLDGVLSDARARQRHLEPGRRDWDAFYEACSDDPVTAVGARVLGLLDPSLRVVLVTGRPERVRPQTLEWLERSELRWDLLVMRLAGDQVRVSEYKRRVVGALREADMEIVLALEDDPVNHAMYVEEGIPCLYVHSGYYA